MLAQTHFADFLLPETVVREDGAGTPIELASAQGRALHLTLGVTRIIEQESLELSIWGSADGVAWGPAPLASFPQKFYCGTYSLALDLSRHPGVKYLRVQWKLNRWGRGDAKPLFGFFVFAEETVAALTAG